jgi:hypothetical protein
LLSAIFSISKTLGPELETLSILNRKERIIFLQSLQKNILNDKISGSISSSNHIYSNSYELQSYRKALSFQFRSIMVASPLLLPNSIVTGISINSISICVSMNSIITQYISSIR